MMSPGNKMILSFHFLNCGGLICFSAEKYTNLNITERASIYYMYMYMYHMHVKGFNYTVEPLYNGTPEMRIFYLVGTLYDMVPAT